MNNLFSCGVSLQQWTKIPILFLKKPCLIEGVQGSLAYLIVFSGIIAGIDKQYKK